MIICVSFLSDFIPFSLLSCGWQMSTTHPLLLSLTLMLPRLLSLKVISAGKINHLGVSLGSFTVENALCVWPGGLCFLRFFLLPSTEVGAAKIPRVLL